MTAYVSPILLKLDIVKGFGWLEWAEALLPLHGLAGMVGLAAFRFSLPSREELWIFTISSSRVST